jgi:hypothetical protein
MRDLLPSAVLDVLRDRYVAGVANAEATFDESRADEDAVTGALGQSIAMPQPMLVATPEAEYFVRISYRKIRGRGPNAPEKRYGADGVFQISVTDRHGRIIRQKALPFQSKMNWRGKNASLANQASHMEQELGGGLVIDFSQNGYKACPSQSVAAGRGSRTAVDRYGVMRPLGQILSRDFLDCVIGKQGLYFDVAQEEFVHPTEPGLHVVTTEVGISRDDVA